MITSDTVVVKWSNRSIAYFKSKGYKFTKNGDSFIAKISDLDPKTTTKIKLKCDSPECEEIFEMEYRFYRDRKSEGTKDFCSNCKRRWNDKGEVFYNTTIIKAFLGKGLSLLPNQQYKNNSTKLKFTCDKHPEIGEQTVSWRTFGEIKQPCKSCRTRAVSNVTTKKSFKTNLTRVDNFPYFKKYLLEEKSLLLSPNQEIYSKSQKIYYTCLKHKEPIEEVSNLYNVIKRDGCKRCIKERTRKKNSGSNSPFWKGGRSNLSEFLRESDIVKSWKLNVLKHYNYKCGVYDVNGELEVHHKYSFNKIVDEMLTVLNLPLKESIGLYNDTEILKMKQYIEKTHTIDLGVPLLKEVHKQYHKIYKYDNTYEQFEEFQKRCANGEFETLLCFGKEH